ncbi:MAG: hypothetical protein HDR80_01410 [Bacteroides sp.]|nr:hypothetical protein [Bacteroides sp.]
MNLLTRKILPVCLLLVMTLAGASCSREAEPSGPGTGLSLLLRVGVADRGGVQARTLSRASADYDFQSPALATEKLHTLRVVIVDDATGTVTHNHLEPLSTPASIVGGMRFEVDFSTDYTLYLIGNEAGIPGVDVSGLFGSTLAVGHSYPAGLLEELTVAASAPGESLIDNSGVSSSIIPMSEKFSITTVDRPQGPQTVSITMEENLFVTRAASRFSFKFFKSEDYAGDNTLEVRSIRISGIADREYLFPNSTEYLPAKGEATSSPDSGRLVTSFATPSEAVTDFSRFEVRSQVPIKVGALPTRAPGSASSAGTPFSPEIYFPESRCSDGAPMTCSISFDGETYLPPVELPNLPGGLPRNTHAVVNITIGNNGVLLFEVSTLPWTTEYFEIDFTHNVAMAEDGALAFAEGTFSSLDKSRGRLVLNDYPEAVRGSFGISSPLGARWTAFLVAASGELNSIRFRTVDDAGQTVYTDYLTGFIDGRKVTFDVAPVMAAGESARSAVLQVMVTLHNGLTIPVNVLKNTEYGSGIEFITFIQNPK